MSAYHSFNISIFSNSSAAFDTQAFNIWKADVLSQEASQPQQVKINNHTNTNAYHANVHTDNGHDNHGDSGHDNHGDSGHNNHNDAGHDNHGDTGHNNHGDNNGHNNHMDNGGSPSHTDNGSGDLHYDWYNTPHYDWTNDTHWDTGGHENHSDSGNDNHNDAGHDNHGDAGHNNHNDAGHNNHNDSQGHNNNIPHSDIGFRHTNYIPSVPQIFDITANDKLSKTVTIGYVSFDKNTIGEGTQDVGSRTVKYTARIRRLKNKEGENALTGWYTLVNNMPQETFDINTIDPFNLGNTDKYAYEGTYELQIHALNDTISEKGVTEAYMSSARSLTIQLIQNELPDITVRNGEEFIDFIFGPDGVIDKEGNLLSYSDALYIDASEEQQEGIFISVSMMDKDQENWQKGWIYLVDSFNNEISGTRTNIIWDDDIIAKSGGTSIIGYAFISKDRFINGELNLEDVKIMVEVSDYEDSLCSIPTGAVIKQYTISALDNTHLSFQVDIVKPIVVVNNTDYAWKNADISIDITYSDEGTGMKIEKYYISESAETPGKENYVDYDGEIVIKTDGQYYIHFMAADRVGNEQVGCYGPYKRDTFMPTIENDNEEYHWTNQDININLSVSEAGLSGLNSFTYSITDSTDIVVDGWTAYTEAITLSEDGQHYLHVKAIDNAGNESYEIYGPYSVDKQAPFVDADNQDYNWKNSNIEVNLSYLPNGISDVISMKYFIAEHNDTSLIGDELWLDYTEELTISTDGIYYIHYLVENEAGTRIKGVYGPYRRDTAAPIIIIPTEENGTSDSIYRYVNEILINPQIEDSIDIETVYGVTTIKGEAPYTLYPFDTEAGISFAGDGTEGLQHYYVYIRATDEAGNISEEWSEVFRFNNMPPEISKVDIHLTDGYAQGVVDFGFFTSDPISGELGEDTLIYRIYRRRVGGTDDYELAVESLFDPENPGDNRSEQFIDFYTADYQHAEKHQFYFEIEDLAGNKTIYPIGADELLQPVELTVRKEVEDLEINLEGPIMTFEDRIILNYNTPTELSAAATFVDGTSMAVYPDITWSLSDTSIAELTPIGDSGKVTLMASDIGTLTITARDNLTGIEIAKEIELTKPIVAFAPIEDLQIIYGNTMSITVDVILEDSSVYNNYPYLVITASEPDFVSINGNQITAVGVGTTTITVTDAFDISKHLTFELLVKKSPQQRLEDIVIPTDTPVPSFELPELEPGQSYTISVTHNPSGEEVIYIETEGGWVTLEGLQEGHNYCIHFTIIDDESNVLAERTINYTIIDITSPEITGVYILHGKLYVLARDNYKLHNTPYGFQVLSNGTATILSVQEDEYGSVILVSDLGGSVSNINFSASNNITVAPPKRVYIKVIDEYINEAEVDVNVTQYNQVLYGTVPQDIINQIHAANNPPGPSTPPPAGTIEVPLPQEIIEIIQDVLGKDNLTVEAPPTSPNSGQGTLHIKTPKYIDELREALLKHNYNGTLYYRIDVIEKGLNRLVYTNALNDIREIIIPGLTDSTTYIVRISIVHDGTRLAFREIEQQTADATPPVIEKVVISNGSLQVFARDNMKLHDAADQYQLQIGNNTVSFNPFGVQALNGLQVASLDISSIIASNWNQQAWTSESRLSGLDTGTRVKVIVRDHAENYTMTDIEVQGDGTFYDTVNGTQPLDVRPNQSVELQDILQDLLQQYNDRNPDNAIDMDNINLEDFDMRLSDPSIAYFENGRLVTRGNGQLIITFVHRKTGMMYKYSILISDIQSFDRRIIIQTGSETDVERAFSSSIERHFKGQEIIFVNENDDLGELDLDTLIFKANDSEGLIRIIITNGKKQLPVYIIVVKDKFPESDIQLIKTQLSYVLKEGDALDIRDISVFYNEGYGEANTDYLIVEADSGNVEVNGNLVKAISEGLGSIHVIDLVTQRIEVIDFRIIAISDTQVNPVDIEGHWAEDAIEAVLSRGILEDLNSSSFSPDEYVTRLQLLKGFSELKVYLRDSAIERRNALPLEISREDVHYYSIMNALNKLTIFEVEYIFGRTPNLSNTVSREETAALLALELGLKAVDNTTDYVDIGRSGFREEILAINEASIMEGYEASFNPEGSLTRAEMAAIFNRLITLME